MNAWSSLRPYITLGVFTLLFFFRPTVSLGETPAKPGVWCDRNTSWAVSTAHQSQLLASLKRITGWTDVCFTCEGMLSTGKATNAVKGSDTARQVLLKAVRSGVTFIIEDYSGSDEINFGIIERYSRLKTPQSREEARYCVMKIDFNDFDRVEASDEVREAFDVGFTFLHELLHGLGYEDSRSKSELGLCERVVNQARDELGLPLRDQYFADAIKLTFDVISWRIRFIYNEKRHNSSKQRWQYLFFIVRQSREESQPDVASTHKFTGSDRDELALLKPSKEASRRTALSALPSFRIR